MTKRKRTKESQEAMVDKPPNGKLTIEHEPLEKPGMNSDISGMVDSPCSISDNRGVTLVENTVISH